MKNRERKGRLVALLAKGFLGFTAAVLAVAILTVCLSNEYYTYLSSVPDIDGLREDKNMLSGNYEKVSVSKYLGPNGAFAVADMEGNVLYRTAETLDKIYTQGELACIRSYDEYTYLEHTSFISQSGRREHLFIKYIYEDEYEIEEQVMILNENYKVVGGGFDADKKYYTPDEVDLLTGESFPDFNFMKCQLDSERILLTLSEVQDYEYYSNLVSRADRVYLVVIPLYIIVLTVFLLWINRKIKNPLVELNRVIDTSAGGSEVRAGELKGPWEIRQIGETFDRMTARLEASEKERQRLDGERQKMLAAISHDLKTPVTVISGYTKAIRDGKVPQERLHEYLERIDSKAEELNGMISSFYEFSKVEHPDFTLQTEKTDMCEFLRSYLADRYDDIEFHGFSLQALIPEDCQVYSMIDRKQMRRVLDNILYNTLRHNRLGTVLAAGVAQTERTPEGVPWVRIFIADNGSGISPVIRSKIFEPFVMGDESRTGRGSGLGLSIAKNIVSAHGGEIKLCEIPHGGFSTEFEILLRAVK